MRISTTPTDDLPDEAINDDPRPGDPDYDTPNASQPPREPFAPDQLTLF